MKFLPEALVFVSAVLVATAALAQENPPLISPLAPRPTALRVPLEGPKSPVAVCGYSGDSCLIDQPDYCCSGYCTGGECQ